MLRLLISTSTFPLRDGDGLPRFVYDLAEALTARADVAVLAPGAPGAAAHETMGALDVHRFTYFRPAGWQALAYGEGMRQNFRASAAAKLQPGPFLWRQARALRRLVHTHRADVVNAHWLFPQGLTAAWVRGRTPFRHVLSVHAGDIYLLEKLPGGRAMARYVVARSDAVLAAGTRVRDRLDALLGYASNAVVQPMGVHVARFAPPDCPLPEAPPFPGGFLLFFGRFAEKKGAIYLLRALPLIRQRRPDLGLVLIGYGAEEARLREESTRLGIEDAVRFIGRQPHDVIAGYLHRCRAAVVPSIVDQHGETEGMPTVVCEALAAGARVVACDVDGIPDVVRHGENGWLCPPKDPHALAARILEALDTPDDAPIRTAARASAEALDWRHVAQRYGEMFEAVLASEKLAKFEERP